MGKKLVSMLLVLAIGLALLPGMTVQTYAAETTPTDDELANMTTMSVWADAEGNNYADIDPKELTINNAEDFMAFQTAMCTYGQTFKDYTVYLTADLDLNEDWSSPVYLEWSSDKTLTNSKQNYTTPTYYLPPTSGSKVFNGVFDGLGHSISGLATQQGSLNSGTAASLFGKTTGENTVVKNLVVLDSAFVNGKTTNLVDKQSSVRPLAGLFTIIESTASATISNCYIDIDLYDAETVSTNAVNSKCGGLVGYCVGDLTIENCMYAGSISNNKATASGDTETAAKKHMGAAVGQVAGSSSAPAKVDITNFVFTGKIWNKWDGASGCIGYCGYAEINMTRCVSLGALCSSATKQAACIAAFDRETALTVVATDCYRVDSSYAMSNWASDDGDEDTDAVGGIWSLDFVTNGSHYKRYDSTGEGTTTTVNKAGNFNVEETNAETLARAVGGNGYRLSSYFTEYDGGLVPIALANVFGWSNLPTDAMTMTDWATAITDVREAYDDITPKTLTINNEDDFKAFQTALTSSAQKDFADYTIYLTNDLDLNPDWNSPVYLEWDETGALVNSVQTYEMTEDISYYLPSTSINKIFNGVFDGMGHSISGLCTQSGDSGLNSGVAASLFGKTTGENTVVKNLAVLDSAFVNGKTGNNGTSDASVKPLAGLFTIIESGASATISNCYIDIDLYDAQPTYSSTSAAGYTAKVGGLVGYCVGSVTIQDCVYAGSISNTLDTKTSQKIDNVVTTVDTKEKWRIGGAVGQVLGTSSAHASVTMENYVFTGTIYHEDKGSSGGIGYCGYADVNMTNCLSLGQLYASGDISGFISAMNRQKAVNVTLTDCFKSGSYDMAVFAGANKDNWRVSVTKNGSDYIRSYDTTTGKQTETGEPVGYNVKSTNAETLAMPIGGDTGYLDDVYVAVGDTLIPADLYLAFRTGEITKKTYSISIESKTWINHYVNITGFEDIDLSVHGGLLVWNSDIGTENAVAGDTVLANEKSLVAKTDDEGTTYYGQHTEVAAPCYGDKVYMRAYVKIGSNYYYGNDYAGHSVEDYCYYQIENSTDNVQRNLCAALLNYGAAAQTRFGHNATDLVNSGLTACTDLNVPAFDKNEMLKEAVGLGVDGTDGKPYTKIIDNSSDIIEGKTRSISLEDRICINYYFDLDDTLTIKSAELLTWSGISDELKEENATVTELTLQSDGRYAASGALVAAPDWDETIYACAKFVTADGTYYTTVSAYSAHQYAADILDLNPEKYGLTQDVVKAMIVYSYLANQFANQAE